MENDLVRSPPPQSVEFSTLFFMGSLRAFNKEGPSPGTVNCACGTSPKFVASSSSTGCCNVWVYHYIIILDNLSRILLLRGELVMATAATIKIIKYVDFPSAGKVQSMFVISSSTSPWQEQEVVRKIHQEPLSLLDEHSIMFNVRIEAIHVISNF